MSRSAFECDLKREGHEVFHGLPRAGRTAPDYTHHGHARVMAIGGGITVTRDGEPKTFRVGDNCAIVAGGVHAGKIGAQGVADVSGRRAVQ